ncbi:MAG: hypothetical protein V4773_06460, partial [Verrucomicrobiota bacterium]
MKHVASLAFVSAVLATAHAAPRLASTSAVESTPVSAQRQDVGRLTLLTGPTITSTPKVAGTTGSTMRVQLATGTSVQGTLTLGSIHETNNGFAHAPVAQPAMDPAARQSLPTLRRD